MPIQLLFLKALEAGERWISVHPNGPDAKAQPVLIKPNPDGTASVIGGVGGALNHLRLTGIKPKGSYKEAIAQRAKERRDRAKAQRQRDKEAGLQASKAKAHAQVTEQTHQVQKDFIGDVAEAMDWDKSDLEFKAPAGTPDNELGKLANAHHTALLNRAREAVNLNRQRLLGDADARAEAEFGDIPLQAEDPHTLSVQDIDPVALSTGLGFMPDYGKRAEARGADEAEIKREASEVTGKTGGPTGTAKKIAAGLDLLKDPARPDKLSPKLVDAKVALELLKLDKKRRLAEKKARDAHKEINDAEVEPKAAVIEVDDAKLDKAVADEMANDLRTISTRAFLSEVGKTAADPVKALARHVGAGAYNAVNALALAAGGAALLDRSVVDVLGVAGAAEVLARRLQSDLSPEALEDVTGAMEDFHLAHYMAATEEALARAGELKKHAEEIELSAHEHGGDLGVLQEANKLRAEAAAEAAEIMGTTLGETEANAALVYALKRGKSDKPFEVSLGDLNAENAIRQLRAIGLERGDYTVDSIGGNRVATITPAGLARLAQPVHQADLEQVRRNLSIIGGGEDQEDWLPQGFSNRPDLALDLKPGVAPQLAQPFQPGPDLETSIKDYIGGRAADGDAPSDIVSDLQSAAFFQKVGDTGKYRDLLDKLAPLQDADGKMTPPETLRAAFEDMADAYVGKRGERTAAIHRQTFEPDHVAMDAVHRALAEEPAGVAAYKPIGELTPQDQGAIRDWFARNVAKESPEAAGMRAELEGMTEPEQHVEDMFGDKAVNPDWSDWKQKKADLTARLNASSTTWPKYVESMRSPQAAYAATQDLIQSRVGEAFARHYNTLKPDKALKLGRASVRGALNHLDAVDPKAREARAVKERALVDRLRERAAGRYAAGSVVDKLQAAREDEAGLQAAQMGFFAAEEEAKEQRPLAADERHSLGQAAESQLAKLIPAVGQNFKPDQPVKLFRPTMSGGANWARQRAIKMIGANKRVALTFGTGSGKTAIGLGSFTDLHSQGKVKRGLFLAPSSAQGNFGADALRFVEPGKYKWHCAPGAGREERIAAYKNPSNHFNVVTHQAFRDDMIHLGAKQAGVSEEDMAGRLSEMSRKDRTNWVRSTMRAEGMAFDYLNVDEGHNLLNRRGKENSRMADVIDAVSDATPYYVNASADPWKNDVSEAFSLLQKMDPERYTDQAAFMRQYGANAHASNAALKRELARFQYPSKIDPDVTVTRKEVNVPVSAPQEKALAELDRNLARVRLDRLQGKVNVAAVKAIAPGAFDGVDGADEEAVAKQVAQSIGIIKETAIRKILDSHPDGGKLDAVLNTARERKGKPGIIFSHSLDSVEAYSKRLTGEGFRVVTLTGKDSAAQKHEKAQAFNPDQGERSADIIVCSDAGATGANLQSGQWVANADTPDTAMTWCQRNGRAVRIGQKNDVELIDLVSDHVSERRRRARLREKYMMREMATSPMEALDDTGVAMFLKQRRLARDEGQAA